MRPGCLDCKKIYNKSKKNLILLFGGASSLLGSCIPLFKEIPLNEWPTGSFLLFITLFILGSILLTCFIVILLDSFRKNISYSFVDADGFHHLHKIRPNWQTRTFRWFWNPNMSDQETNQDINDEINSPIIKFTISAWSRKAEIINTGEHARPHGLPPFDLWNIELIKISASDDDLHYVRLHEGESHTGLSVNLRQAHHIMILHGNFFTTIYALETYNPNWETDIQRTRKELAVASYKHKEELIQTYSFLHVLTERMQKSRPSRSTRDARLALEAFIRKHFPDEIQTQLSPERHAAAEEAIDQALAPTVKDDLKQTIIAT